MNTNVLYYNALSPSEPIKSDKESFKDIVCLMGLVITSTEIVGSGMFLHCKRGDEKFFLWIGWGEVALYNDREELVHSYHLPSVYANGTNSPSMSPYVTTTTTNTTDYVQ